MKFTINIKLSQTLYEIKEQFQQILKKDIHSSTTSIKIQVNPKWEWIISGMALMNWASELGLAVGVQSFKTNFNTKEVFIIQRITGEDDINKSKYFGSDE